MKYLTELKQESRLYYKEYIYCNKKDNKEKSYTLS